MVLYAAASALFNLNIFHAMRQNEVDQLVSGAVAFRGKPVKFRQRILADANCNDTVSIVSALLDNSRIVLHCTVPLNLY